MTIHESIDRLAKQLERIYDPGEAVSIATWVIEYVTGFDKSLIAQSNSILISSNHEEKIHAITSRLLNNEPVQYVLEEAWFYGMKFFVNKNVLIPRPETEELVDLVIKENKEQSRPLKVLDIGTGSGCIPIVLANKLRDVEIWSADISLEALEVAKQNAANKKVTIHFIQMDFLNRSKWNELPDFDIIVSNPPYVTNKEKSTMQKNVMEYEPSIALFVPDDDPLIFYKAIAEFSSNHLKSLGKIYCELNESPGLETLDLFKNFKYQGEIMKDLQGKPRFLKVSISDF